MSLLNYFVETPLAGTLGWALLHSLWHGVIVSALLAGTLVITRSPRIRYVAACIAMLALVAGFALTLMLVMPTQAEHLHGSAGIGLPAWLSLPEQGMPSSWFFSLAAIAPWLSPFWVIGVWVFCLLRLVSWISVRRLRTRGVCRPGELWESKLAALAKKMRVYRHVQLLESCLAEVPLVLGHLRPAILMPVGLLSGLAVDQIEAILLHELAHIRRHDYLINAIQRLVESLFFYHPAVWWMSRIARRERENCCDDAVVSVTGNAREYAVVLAALEQNRLSGREPAVAAAGGPLMKRIRRLLHPTRSNGGWAPLVAAAIFLVTAGIAMSALQAETARQGSATTVNAGTAVVSKYSRWLDQEVVYIIDDAERGAFQSLASDEERDHFIEQFWERRNPTPGASRNAFKEEHYRRIAYANKHFQTPSGTPGWQTDRGHMYIVYGPPDEIADPKGSQKPFATEVWLYRRVEGIGANGTVTFVDRTGLGDFHLAPGTPR
jgi:GWxTD domain-containing protein